jgi:phosphotransacetylase
MEGVVLRPLIEVTDNRGNRIMAKHKRDEFRETASPRVVEDIEKLKVLQEADLIVQEWVTQERLKHVLDKLPQDINVESTGKVIAAMIEDVYREGKGEIVESDAVKKAISKKTAGMFKQYLKQKAGL